MRQWPRKIIETVLVALAAFIGTTMAVLLLYHAYQFWLSVWHWLTG